MYRHFLDLISLDFWCPHFFVSVDITVGHRYPNLYIRGAADQAITQSLSSLL